MKKIAGISLILCVWVLFANAQQAGIRFFEGSWEEAVAKSVKENKIIFIDCNTTWCGPCKILARNVFTQKPLADFYNSNFINVSMDMEKGIGPELSKRFAVSAYPTLLYLKPGGYVISSVVGLKDADTLMICARSAIQQKDNISMTERFNKGPRDSAFVRKYVTAMLLSQPPGWQKGLMDTVVKQEGYEALLQEKYWNLLSMERANTPVFEWFLNNRARFEELYGTDAVNEKIADTYVGIAIFTELNRAAKTDTSVYSLYKKHLQSKNLPCLSYLYAVVDFYVAGKKGDFAAALSIADAALSTDSNAWQLHLMARWANWLIIAQTDERFHAAKWAARAAALRNNSIDKTECRRIADDLLNDVTPTVYPSPRVYGYNVQ